MSPLSGYTTTLPDEILVNPAIVKVGATVLGVTKGGVSWDPERTMETVAFDGARTPIKGLSRVKTYGGKLGFTLLQLGTVAEIERVEPGASTATGGTGVTSLIVPKSAGALFDAGEYLQDLRAIWELGAGSEYWALYLPWALCTKWSIKGADSGEAEVACEFQPAVDLSSGGTPADAPYRIEIRTALP